MIMRGPLPGQSGVVTRRTLTETSNQLHPVPTLFLAPLTLAVKRMKNSTILLVSSPFSLIIEFCWPVYSFLNLIPWLSLFSLANHDNVPAFYTLACPTPTPSVPCIDRPYHVFAYWTGNITKTDGTQCWRGMEKQVHSQFVEL